MTIIPVEQDNVQVVLYVTKIVHPKVRNTRRYLQSPIRRVVDHLLCGW